MMRKTIGTFLFAMFCLGAGCAEKTTLTVTGIEPENGPSMGGDRLSIEGTGFGTQGFSVYVGGKKATKCSRKSPTSLVCETPGGEAGKTVDVQVLFDDAREATLKGAYTYTDNRGMGFTEDKPKAPAPAPEAPK
jgi:hypothetical protein